MNSPDFGCASFPLWLRSIACLTTLCCFPGVILAACFGTTVPWPMIIVAGELSRRGVAIVCGESRRRRRVCWKGKSITLV